MSCCPADCSTIKPGSSKAVLLSGLVDLNGTYVNTATVYFELIDPEDDSVLESGSMDYLSDSNGNYRGTITAGVSATLARGKIYRVQSTAVAGDYTLVDDLDVICE